LPVQIEFSPDAQHCIETVARTEYKRLLAACLQGSQINDDVKQKLELLRLFLETMDFRELRQQCDRYLQNGQTIKFIISDTCGAICYKIVPY
jgi:hypothetical protein